MNCKAIESFTIPYLDGSIDMRRRGELEAHLGECGGCRLRIQQFRQMWGALDELATIRPSVSFDAAVRARVAQEGVRRGLWGWIIAPSPNLAFSVTALIVFSVWLSSMPRTNSPQPPDPVADTEFRMIADLPVLEDYDVLADFDALSEVAVQQPQSEDVQISVPVKH